MKVVRKLFEKFNNSEAKKKALQSKKLRKLGVAVFLLICLYLILANTFFDEERIGTKQHRAEAPYCQSDDECILYNCTNCGNKFWVDKNDDTNCDKKSSIIIGCSCVEGQCKRVVKTK